jgi:hypothetical protein
MRSYASLKSAISLFFDSLLRAARVRNSTRGGMMTRQQDRTDVITITDDRILLRDPHPILG